ncbi:MAG: tetratricopeptide repeat protein [Bacteroidia bacterium]|nr:tetratricopeptide repeat protein [Bacteroidia bacterium]
MTAYPVFRKITKFLPIILLLSVFSCSKEKDTLTARLYHNTTSYFNGYYNADFLFKETVTRLEEQYKFAEQGFIEVVYYGTEDEVKSFDSDFETIIKKNDAVMFKHPNGDWIDDCRLLNGKSWFYRKNYTLAMENFDFILETFPESQLAPEVHFWIAKSHYMMENPEMTKTILDKQLINNDTVYIEPNLEGDLSLFRTRLAIEDKDYKTAVKILNDNILYIKNDLRRARAHFLLGQLYSEIKEYPKALENFTLVEKFSADYGLTFASKIKIARLYVEFQKGKDDDGEVNKYLTKLLKDEKNFEYRDQVYYEFALLEIKKDNIKGAIDYLKEAIRANVSNQRQKALSYFKIGQIYFFDLQNYTQAQTYYDSAATAITPTAPEYKEITTLAATLKDYITYKNTIAYQDSMLWLSTLPKDTLDAIINRLAAEEKRKQEEEQERMLKEMQSPNNNLYNPALQQFQDQGNRSRQSQGGVWYFDNPAAVSSGKLQFEQMWGKRINEDNWRRSKKMSEMALADDSDSRPEQPTEKVDSTLLKQYGDKYKYYKDIPTDSEGITAANIKIEDALYNLGQLYVQKLNEPDSAIKILESLLDRYENSEYTLRARYSLYNLYNDKRSPLAEVHRNFIINEHPETVYAYLILDKDPRELKRDELDFEFAYDGLFSAYSARQFETSIGFSDFLLSQEQFQSNPEIDFAKLYYIRGMSFGYLGEKDSLAKTLTYLVGAYPESEVTPLAQKTLNYLKTGVPAVNKAENPGEKTDAESSDPNNEAYKGFTDKIKPTDKIFVLIFVDKNKISKTDANTQISDFNKASFNDLNLKVFTFLYQQTHLLPYISSFKTVEEAQKYISDFSAHPASKNILTSGDEKIFYISHTNFKVAYGQKRMEDYIQYYEGILNK